MRTVQRAGLAGLVISSVLSGCARPAAPRPVAPMVEYLVPRENAFPNDPAVAADGSVWFTDRVNSLIGRLDPETGDFSFHATPTPKSAPYDIAVAPDGAEWYSASRAGLVGRLDPATGEIREYPIPGSSGAHSVVVHAGNVWFTLRRDHRYGKLDPVTGGVALYDFEPLQGRSVGQEERGPYSLRASPDGSLWFSAMGNPALCRVDPRDGSLDTFFLPDPESWARRIAVDARGGVWYSDFPRARIGRLDPKTADVREYPSLRVHAEPYGIAVGPDGRIWVHESRSGLLNVLDPESGEVFTLPVPGERPVIRAIAVDHARGRLWFALSGTNRIGRIDLPGR